MKIRTGYVSNSSSSSFLVVFPYRPKTVKDVKKILFGTQESYDKYSTLEISKTIFNTIKDMPDISILPEQAIFAAKCGADSEAILKLLKLNETDNSRKLNEYLEMLYYIDDDFFENMKDKFVCTFEFDDKSDYSSMLEYGEIFNELPHIKENNH